jgi:cell shape-determining protein MreC
VIQVENATAQLNGVNDENEGLKQELTASKAELNRLIQYERGVRWSHS